MLGHQHLQTANNSEVRGHDVKEAVGTRTDRDWRFGWRDIACNTGVRTMIWSVLSACGVTSLIAADSYVTPANLSAFHVSFYAAPLSCVRRGIDTEQRVAESFELADRYYRSIHATCGPQAKFRLTKL